MDQKKIGKYIAGKRKALGLTQVQLAEKLNMSNKSVSKWERGVCLPDVSLYTDLCDVLGISLNEFLAGEDLLETEIIPKSEETIINIATDNKRSRHRANGLILLLIAAVLIMAGILFNYILNDKKGVYYGSGIIPLTEESPEVQTADLLGKNEAWLYRYDINSKYNRIQIRYFWYKNGELTEDGTLLSYAFSGDHYGRGMIAILDDYENGGLTAEVTLEGRNYRYGPDGTVCDVFELPLEGQSLQEWQDTYTRSVEIPQDVIPLNTNSYETGIMVMRYDKSASPEATDAMETNEFWPKVRAYCPELAEYDYAVFITAKIYRVPSFESWKPNVKTWP